MRSPVYTTPFTLFMPQELVSRLKDAAAHDYKTQSEFVRESIREKIEREREAVRVSGSLIPQGSQETTATPGTQVIAFRYAESKEPLV